MSAIVLVEEAVDRLARAVTIDDVLEVHDQAKAMEHYARERRLGGEAYAHAYVIIQRSWRRFGELSSALPHAKAGRKPKSEIVSDPEVISKTAVLKAAGVNPREAANAERLAAIPLVDFEANLEADRQRIIKHAERGGGMHSASAAVGYDGDESYTPADVLEAGREALGGDFDLDPASCAEANELVRAARYFTKEQNGLTKFWRCKRAWCNPPYSRDLIGPYAAKFVIEYQKKRMASGLLLVNNDTDTEWCQSLLERFAVCFTRGRISFIQNGKPATNNRQGQAIFYAGRNRDRFKRAFRTFGEVHAPL